MSKGFHKASHTRFLVAAFIFLVATCSFFGNSFSAADPSWFTQHQLDSEQLVLDGILHSRESNHGKPIVLGRYTRPEIPEQYSLAHRLFSESNQDGKFNSYDSQYGLQVKVFAYLVSKGLSIAAIQLLVASCMALCLTCSYVLLRANRFSGMASAAFSLSMLLAPWVIVFARNLYWVPFTWFAPSLVTALSATVLSRGTTNRGQAISNIFLVPTLFCFVLVKLLCGYEYITAIYLSSLLAYISISYRNRIHQSIIIKQGLMITLIFALAFGMSIGMHASQLKALGKPGLQTIWDTAAKRASSTTPSSIVARVCYKITDPVKLKDCQDRYSKSLTSSPLRVVYRYLFVPSFLPWVGHGSGNHPLRLAFPAFGALIVFAYRRNFQVAIAMGSFFIGSISWFLAAKGHSYIHYSINYVLWYLLFVPVAVLLVGERLQGSFSSGLVLLRQRAGSSRLKSP
jgi:hypothetical protein